MRYIFGNGYKMQACTVAVIIGLKKNFNKTNHKLLIKNMLNMLVLVVILISGYEAILASERNIIREYQAIYLTELIFVDIGDINSDVYIAPRWFTLSPKLFILFINHLCEATHIMKFILFADDANNYCSGY